MNKIPVIAAVIVFLLLAGSAFARWHSPHPVPPVARACTLEAKICPDGTSVGRTGPLCEFAECPALTASSTPEVRKIPVAPSANGIVTGTVTLSPICPVEQNPPNPKCAPKGFMSYIIATPTKGGVPQQTQSDSNGNFTISVPAGTYYIQGENGPRGSFPRCSPETVVVHASKTAAVALSCDTGIR